MNREQAKDLVKGYLESYLQSKGINTSKPFRCLNPDHADRHPSMSYDKERLRVKCFSCGASYDIFDLIGIDYGLTDPKDIFNKAYELYGITIDSTQPTAAIPARKEEPTTEDYTDYYKRLQDNRKAPEAQEYLQRRGISEDTAAKYWLGYDNAYKTFNTDADGNRNYTTWRALIIPTGKGSYVARNIDKPADPEKKNRYRKKGASLLFNSKALYNDSQPCFIVEGELDALSIIEAGGQAVGLGSLSNTTKLLDLLKKQKPAQPLMISLDADEEGQRAEEKLIEDLTALQIRCFLYDVCGTAKDANEALIQDREGFIADIAAAERIPEEELKAQAEAAKERYLKENNAAAYLQEFKDGITASVNTPVISTGFANLDKILDGGLYEGLYVLGAISSLGKTTLLLQLADNLAQQGQDVLIFSLEMARTELMAKSISRYTYLLADNKADAKTNRGITAGARYANYSQKEKDLIDKATEQYAEDCAQHLFIHEGIGNVGTEKIREVVQQHIAITGNKPVVFIDYIQILAPPESKRSLTDKQVMDKNILELKRLSRDEKITIIGISSFNRESYKDGSKKNDKRGKVSTTDYKESGALEYSADVLIGLEFKGAGKDYNEQEEKQKDPRQIRLVILKNRNGKAWVNTCFEYYPYFNYYKEEDGFADAPEDVTDIFESLKERKAK